MFFGSGSYFVFNQRCFRHIFVNNFISILFFLTTYWFYCTYSVCIRNIYLAQMLDCLNNGFLYRKFIISYQSATHSQYAIFFLFIQKKKNYILNIYNCFCILTYPVCTSEIQKVHNCKLVR